MGIYIANIIITIMIIMITEKRDMVYQVTTKENVKVPIYVILTILFIWTYIYAGRGLNVGSDTSGYYGFYQLLTKSDITLKAYINQGGDWLFETVRYCVNRASKGNWYVFIFIMGIFTYLPVLITLRSENPRNFLMSILLYIFMFHYYYGFNAIRQTIAISISFMAYMLYFKKNRYIRYLICMIIAYGFHSTAIFMILIHFLSKLSIKSKILWIINIFMLVGAGAFGNVWNMAINALTIVGNNTLADRYIDNTFTGSGYIRVLICLVPLILGFWKYHLIQKEEKEKIDPFLIFGILNVIFMMYSTHNWLFARLAMYLDIYMIIYIPKLEKIFTDNCKMLGKTLILLLYFVYMLLLLIHGEANVYPYNFL